MAALFDWLRRAAYRLSTAPRRTLLRQELDDEMAFHRELLQRDLVFVVAVLAMIAPAASALRIAPMQVLREE